jgi:hypothetical protein
MGQAVGKHEGPLSVAFASFAKPASESGTQIAQPQ